MSRRRGWAIVSSLIQHPFRHPARKRADRAFLISLHARYMGVPINLAMTGAGVRNDEVTVLTMGVEKSATYEARLAKGLLREQVAKLERQLR